MHTSSPRTTNPSTILALDGAVITQSSSLISFKSDIEPFSPFAFKVEALTRRISESPISPVIPQAPFTSTVQPPSIVRLELSRKIATAAEAS